MQRKCACAMKCFWLGIAVLSMSLTALAGRGHNFSGDYKIVHSEKQGDNVQVRLSVSVINNSGADVKNVTISMVSSLLPEAPRGPLLEWEKQQTAFTSETLHYNEHKIVPRLEGTFTIPSSEYEQWHRANGPRFLVGYEDTAGRVYSESIDLAPAP